MLALVLLLLLVALRVADPAPLETLRLKTFDLYQLALAPKPTPQQVIIVDIDEKSLNELGQWPWPRSLLAKIIDKVGQAGAVAVGLDILFPEHDRMSPANMAGIVEAYDKDTAARLRTMKSNDEVFADAMTRTRVVLGQSGYHKELKQWHAGDLKQSPIAMLGPDPQAFLDTYPGMVRNVPELEAKAQGRGMVSLRPETDGVVRKMPLVMMAQGKMLPSLSLELLRVATGQSTILIRSGEAGVSSLVLAGVAMPTDSNAKAWLHFHPHNQQIFVSAADLLADRVNAEVFKGRLVLLGASATGLFDLKATPVEAAMPGVEAHAQLINAVLSKTLLQRPAWANGMEVSLALLIGLGLIALLPRFGAVITVFAGGVVAAAVVGASWWAFAQKALIFDYAFPLMASLAVSSVLIVLGYLQEEIDRRRIRTAFGQYLSQDMVAQLTEDPDKLILGGETKPMTILFSDVRGFTTISEKYKSNPQGLTMLINSLLTPLSEAVVAHKGTIDKYMGDNIMAFWNAPLADGEHAYNACCAALDMTRRLGALNQQRVAAGDVALEIGVGINTGECVVGNMGSDFRFDYTVLGDAVNLSARLEGQTKSYGTKIIIGRQTAEAVQNRLAVLLIDRVRVKGKNEPEDIFALLGDSEMAATENFRSLAKDHDVMLEAYYDQRWDDVRKIARKCAGRAAKVDFAEFYTIYADRAAEFSANPPGSDWEGVNDILEK
ncbi:CHASE2 domain-containing protein [Anderseniella sp. Alg231-50]|uniref:CHASE2 domain-containing protein n=1 Tax=Anderseniella sp. Alg231-50 TaxID=1922226 RepID=UPI00307B4501